MKNVKKIAALGLSATMAMGMLPATLVSADEATGTVYYLNFKPEQADQWKDLAEKYTEETGVQVDVVTAASGTYESTLKSEMAKSEAPTLFQVNGPVGLATWKDYCYDLKDSEVYKHLKSDDFALKNDDGSVPGIAYVIETYGLIYNKKLLNDYIATDGAVVSSVDEINNFETLKAVADDIQAKKDDLGIEGAFASTGFDSSSDWRFKTHLQTCRSTMSTKQTVSIQLMRSREHILITTSRFLICISQILHVSRLYFPARLVRMQLLSLHLARQYSIRMVLGLTMISKTTK